MIVCPLNYDGASYPVTQLRHDLSEFFSQHPNDSYIAYDDHTYGQFCCEMSEELELLFVLANPRYMRYVRPRAA